MLTPEEKKKVEEIKKDPAVQEAIKGKTDEDILAAYRFVEDGKGIQVYDSVEEYRAAMKKKKAAKSIDEIEEL